MVGVHLLDGWFLIRLGYIYYTRKRSVGRSYQVEKSIERLALDSSSILGVLESMELPSLFAWRP